MHRFTSSAPARRPHSRRLAAVVLGAVSAILLAATVTLLARSGFASTVAPFAPSAEDGHVSAGTVVTVADDHLPAVDRLDPALVEALRRAGADAAPDGVVLRITSGWRSERYQEWLYDRALRTYGSEEVARQFVATADRSRHITGDAVDIGPLEAQLWLIEHGAEYGLCQMFANERWHFELATSPGGECPEMKRDASE